MLRTLIAIGSFSVLVTTANADVNKDKARAKQLYEEGLAHYNLAEYDAAIAAWKASYVLSKAPLLLFNIAQAHRLSGHCGKANTFYASYQREAPDPKNRAELEQALALCKNVAAEPDAPVTPDKPAEKPVAPHQQAITPPRETSQSSPMPPRGRTQRIVGLVVGGSGVVLGGVGAAFAFASKSQHDKLDGLVGEWGAAEKQAEAAGKRDNKLAWAFGGVGVAAIVTGGIVYLLAGRSREAPAISITPADGGARLVWGSAF